MVSGLGQATRSWLGLSGAWAVVLVVLVSGLGLGLTASGPAEPVASSGLCVGGLRGGVACCGLRFAHGAVGGVGFRLFEGGLGWMCGG